MTEALPAGLLAAGLLSAHDVDTVFTLSGGHLFPLYDGCVKHDIRLVDTRHEQTAAFAAEGWAKVTRRVGVAALTAGPGVTNGVSAITSAHLNGSPVLVVGGRAPEARWGTGSLQELDHVPIVATITKHAATARDAASVPAGIDTALRLARTPHRGPTFVDVPLDAWGPTDIALPPAPHESEFTGGDPDPEAVDDVVRLVRESTQPALMLGGDVYWGHAEAEAVAFAESARIPVFVNDLGRGTIPADHELAFSRARSTAFNGADLVLVAGTPLDFRLGFGRFGDAQVVHLCDSREVVATHVDLAASTAGDLRMTFAALAERSAGGSGRDDWLRTLRDDEDARRAAEADRLSSDATPIDPARVYGELRKRLARDAIVIGDGGDFVSYAGKYVDGAIGFTLGDLDTLVRHGVNVTAVIGNNGIWGLEKHPMQMIFGYDVVAELRPGTRYDLVAEALGGHGELVREPGEIGPALDRALSHDGLSVINVLTDPGDMYPRSSNLG